MLGFFLLCVVPFLQFIASCSNFCILTFRLVLLLQVEAMFEGTAVQGEIGSSPPRYLRWLTVLGLLSQTGAWGTQSEQELKYVAAIVAASADRAEERKKEIELQVKKREEDAQKTAMELVDLEKEFDFDGAHGNLFCFLSPGFSD